MPTLFFRQGTMKIEEIRNLSHDELLTKELQLKEELFKLNYQRKIGRVEKPHRFKLLRRDIARLQTVLREQHINERTANKT
jgi:large subunit ribosomal protein L29